MNTQQILNALQAPAPVPYEPHFRVEADPRGWRLYDGQDSVGFVHTHGWYAFDLWRFAPGSDVVMANQAEPGPVWDLHTVHNTCINLPYQSLWGGHNEDVDTRPEDPLQGLHEEWLAAAGAELHLSLRLDLPEDQFLEYHFKVFYDPAQARYRFLLDADAHKLWPYGFEPINMMLGGALEDQEARRRWTHSLWLDPRGVVRRLVHSNALFTVTDYGDCFTPGPMGGHWRTKNTPLTGAWVAYAHHAEFNPAMLIHEANVPVSLATCSQLFDEHLIWRQAGDECLDEEGRFHLVMHTELVNLPSELAGKLLDQAVDPIKPRQWRFNQGCAVPFAVGVTNSFEETADPWQPETCPLLVIPDDPGQGIEWCEGVAHSGTRSIQLMARQAHQRVALHPAGAVCRVTPHTRYRFSVWVKTEGAERFARLELNAFEYRYVNIISQEMSAPLTGTSDWTLLEVEMDSGEHPYLMPLFVLYGSGKAWFDDASFMPVQ